MRWRVRFGYDGSGFAGWARQPGLRTVEGEIRRALANAGADPDSLEVASRTDRYVSARANALAVDCDLGAPTLLRLLNGVGPDLFFTAATAVPVAFRVRRATRRVYRYFEPAPVGGLASWRRAARVLVGEIDARSFGRRIAPGAPCWRTVESVVVRSQPGGAEIEIRAPSFVWGMVRKMVGALREHGAGRLPIDRLEAAARGRARLNLPLAEPERLILWEVEYTGAWEYQWAGPNRRQLAAVCAARTRLWARARLLDALESSSSPALTARER